MIRTRTETLRGTHLIVRFRVSLFATDAAPSACRRLLVHDKYVLFVYFFDVVSWRSRTSPACPNPLARLSPSCTPTDPLSVQSVPGLPFGFSLCLHCSCAYAHTQRRADARASSLQNWATSSEGQEAAGEWEVDVLVHFSLRSFFLFLGCFPSVTFACLSSPTPSRVRPLSTPTPTHRYECAAAALSASSHLLADTRSHAFSDCFAVVFFTCRRCVILVCVCGWLVGWLVSSWSFPLPPLALLLCRP